MKRAWKNWSFWMFLKLAEPRGLMMRIPLLLMLKNENDECFDYDNDYDIMINNK